MNELLKAKDELTQDRDAKLAEIASLRQKMTETQESEQKLEKERDEAQTKLQEVGLCLHLQMFVYVLSEHCQYFSTTDGDT